MENYSHDKMGVVRNANGLADERGFLGHSRKASITPDEGHSTVSVLKE
jgi:hypothetical protein